MEDVEETIIIFNGRNSVWSSVKVKNFKENAYLKRQNSIFCLFRYLSAKALELEDLAKVIPLSFVSM